MQNYLIPYPVFYELIRKYSKKHRHYHNWEHINEMLSIADSLSVELSEAQKIAILFHDVIYNIGDKDNEIKSALFMREELEGTYISDETIQIAERIILDTANHQPTIEESKIVLDLDMAHLAFDFNIFLHYRDKIKKEYSIFSDYDFYNGEISFMENTLKQEEILFTDLFDEDKLRANLKKKILINISKLKVN